MEAAYLFLSQSKARVNGIVCFRQGKQIGTLSYLITHFFNGTEGGKQNPCNINEFGPLSTSITDLHNIGLGICVEETTRA